MDLGDAGVRATFVLHDRDGSFTFPGKRGRDESRQKRG
jgi:hypothetical protein